MYNKYMPHRSLEAGRIATKKHYEANKEYYKERNRKRLEQFRSIIAENKAKPCADCGIQYPPYVMDFDHQSDKSFNIANVSKISSVQRLLDEIAKCVVVCSNCHRQRTFERNNASECNGSTIGSEPIRLGS